MSDVVAATRLSLSSDGKLLLRCRYEDREAAKSVPGWQWDGQLKCWAYPVRAYEAILQQFPFAMVDREVKVALGQVAEREQTATEIKLAGWLDAKPIEPMPLKTKPYQHQVAAYNFICRLMGVSKG